jgi:translation initiation factor 2 subunit 3
MGYPGKLPDLYVEIEVDYQLMRIVLGVKNEDGR